MRRLLAAGADINTSSQIGTPLALAILKSRADIIHELLRAQASVTVSAGRWGTLLHVACAVDDYDTIDAILVESKAALNERSTVDCKLLESFMFPSATGTPASRLIIPSTDVGLNHKKNPTPLQLTAMYGCTRAMRRLLSAGAQFLILTSTGQTLEMLATRNGRSKWLAGFLREMNSYYLKYSEIRTYKNPKAFDQYNKDPNGENAIMLAASRGDRDCLKWLLRFKSWALTDVNKLGETALYLAAKNGHEKCVDLLTSFGADINDPGEFDGLTPLVVAARHGHLACVQSLLKSPATFPFEDGASWNWKTTAIHEAAAENHVAIITVLLEAGHQVDVLDNDGHTALMVAAAHNNVDAASALLQERADVTLRGRDSQTAWDIANGRGHTNVTRLIDAAASRRLISRWSYRS